MKMMKIAKLITIVIIVLFISLSAKSLLPKSREVDQMEILKLIGLDYNEEEKKNKASLSFIMNKEESSGSNGNETKTEKQEVMNYRSNTFNDAIRKMQFYTDKTVAGSHIKYFLIGENTAREDIEKPLDEISKNQEIRLSSHVYLVKDMDAYEFLEKIVGSEYEIGDKLSSMEKKDDQKTIVKDVSISKLLEGKLSESEVYLIPTIQFVKETKDLKVIKEDDLEKTVELKKQFDFYGYGIMKDNKLVDFFDEEESIIYNMLINEAVGGNIDIESNDGTLISFGINDISTYFDYKFDNGGNLNEIKINVKFRSNFEEVYNDKNVTNNKNIQEYQDLQEKKVKKQVEDLISKTKELNLDILNIAGDLKLKHPYRFRNIKKIFKDDYNSLNISVEVESSIDRTYDIIQTHK